MKTIVLTLALVSCIARITVAQSPGTTLADSILSGGIMHYYLIYIPKNFNKGIERPLILNMHGYGSNSVEEELFTKFAPVADTAGFLMVYPDGLKDGFNHEYWSVGYSFLPKTDDVKFLSSLIDTLERRYAIDHDRVYATGVSLGGYMSYSLACDLSNKVAAIASVSGSMHPSVFATCAPPRAVPVMEIHGTGDNTVPYNGNPNAVDIDTLVRFWAQIDHCNPSPEMMDVPDINPKDGSNVVHYVYSGGTNGARCELYKVINAGHVEWPQIPSSVVGVNGDFDASTEIWRFFSRYKLSQFAGVSKRFDGPEATLVFYPNPIHNTLHIPIGLRGRTTIRDLTGRLLLSSEETEIGLSMLPSGLYFVRFQTGDTRFKGKLIKE